LIKLYNKSAKVVDNTSSALLILQVLVLRESIGALIMSLIEENGPAASQVAKVFSIVLV